MEELVNPINGLKLEDANRLESENAVLPGNKIDNDAAIALSSDTNSRGQLIDTFEKFPEFPTELRLKVWRRAFPGPRQVHLLIYDGLPPPLPVTLRVNQESREETKKHYQIVRRGASLQHGRLLSIDPTTDEAVLEICHMLLPSKQDEGRFNEAWLATEEDVLKTTLASIQNLHLQAKDFIAMIYWFINGSSNLTSLNSNCILRHFAGLRKVTVTINRTNFAALHFDNIYGGNSQNDDGLADYVRGLESLMKELLESHKGFFRAGAPQLSLM